MRAVGIVGHGADKFTPESEAVARTLIRRLLDGADVMVSGHSPVGGVDIWAEEEAVALGVVLDLKIPIINQWDPPGGYGFKARNLDIAGYSTELHVLVVDELPPGYRGRRWDACYHCHRNDHVKSGACWTAKRSPNPTWHIISNSLTEASWE